MLYNELEQGDILSGVCFGLALLAYRDILLCSIETIRRIQITVIFTISYKNSPDSRLTIHGSVQPQGELTFFHPDDADIAYDGGSDGLFIFKDSGGKTAFIGGENGICLLKPARQTHFCSASITTVKIYN